MSTEINILGSLYKMAILQVISQGAISAPMYSTKGPSMIQSLYPTAFPLKHQQKVCERTFLFDNSSLSDIKINFALTQN